MGDPITLIAGWLKTLLSGWGASRELIAIILSLFGVLIIAVVALLLDVFLVWLERKFVARFQDRLGPNRLGPFGLIQPFADVIKLLIKENIVPQGADKVVYTIAPLIALATVMLLWAVIPFAPTMVGANLNVAALYIVAIGAISTLGIIMAGWASNNKYALLGAFRMVAMVVSYEVPMVLALLIPVILAHSMGFQDIVKAQSGVWFIVLAPIAAVMFYTTSIAELGRAPFDIVEAESEIVAGFHIEYTGIRFGLFYAGELLHALTISAFVATLFFGGWHGWGVEQVPILGVGYLFFKTFIIYWSITWVKYSMPRLRIDQMMNLCWKFLTPLALCLVIITALLDKILSGVVHPAIYVFSQLTANLIIAWIVLLVLRSYARQERRKVGFERPVATAPIVEFSEPVMIEEE